jgi:hypothetical protein
MDTRSVDCNASALWYYVCLSLKCYGLIRRCPLVYQAKWAIKSEGFKLSSQTGSQTQQEYEYFQRTMMAKVQPARLKSSSYSN